ncbi:hypothetical protein [Faecalibacter macacae]|uniref:RHS repeat-associated core domain-containing protein n=1 Tax=Faecalibacter macacae TaxID=1859289 RepID=A0A3L9M565_9FLAO|nr:hypothetical protein [Faecalibacter macacae]RLZ07126.1 hypothetical protein EAH69_11790 [Faecalibacter macacae]
MSYKKGEDGNLKIVDENNYYPFGLKHDNQTIANTANPNYKYKYNDYGAKNLIKFLTNIPNEVMNCKMN